MKVDKRRPLHWFYLLGFLVQVLMGLLLRGKPRAHGNRKLVLLYGHKLNGNLLALYRAMRSDTASLFRPVFLTMDLAYHRQLRQAGEDSIWAPGQACRQAMTEAHAVVSDHGLHAMQPLLGHYARKGLRFVDVWHGIPFKGFDADDFRIQHRYDEVWVASQSQKELYVDKFGFPPDIVHATGYARTDSLIAPDRDMDAVKRGLGLDPETCGSLILFAPTWQQDDQGRSLFPFGLDADTFLKAMSGLCERLGATLLVRQHLNSEVRSGSGGSTRILQLPYARYPDAETILLVSDILVCDWSSIAFDFLLLERPALFLDVPAPFRKGHSLGPEYRYGAIVRDLDDLLGRLGECLIEPQRYWQAQAAHHLDIKGRVYGSYADGGSTTRCIDRLQALTRESSR